MTVPMPMRLTKKAALGSQYLCSDETLPFREKTKF